MSDDEMFQLVDENGEAAGTASRRECHGNPELLHSVVHLHLFNASGELFLQRRSLCKKRYPGLMDTSVGGHIKAYESVEEALMREVKEEIGVDAAGAKYMYGYIYRDDFESEYVHTFMLVYSSACGAIKFDSAELSGGAFYTPQDIEKFRTQKKLTPTFELEYKKLTERNLL